MVYSNHESILALNFPDIQYKCRCYMVCVIHTETLPLNHGSTCIMCLSALIIVPMLEMCPCAELVERVFLRLGAAESDEQLEKALGRFLPAILLKLTSQYKSVQDKVRLGSTTIQIMVDCDILLGMCHQLQLSQCSN